MPGFLIVFCTCGSEEEAGRLARAVIEQRLAACVNILPEITSVYRWKGAIETASERLLLIKTTEERFAGLRDALMELHSYENPEIVGVRLAYGADQYLAWIQASI